MPRRATLLLLGLAACTPLRPLDPVDGGPSALDAARLDASADAARPDAAGDAPGLDAFDPDAFDPGPDAFVETLDAFVPVDAFVPIDGNCLPMGAEVCGGGDEDCDGMIDEGDAVDARTWYPDADRDGYGADVGSITACTRPPDVSTHRWMDRGGDCDDTNEQVRPGRIEQCNAVDDDCNGLLDDGDPCPATTGCSTEVFRGHTYQFCDGRVSWTTAASTCSSWGYHLVHVDDLEENDFVTATAARHGLGERSPYEHVCWIGVQRASDGVLRLTDDTPVGFTRWMAGEPDRDGECVRIVTSTGMWGDALCGFNVDFVCETP